MGEFENRGDMGVCDVNCLRFCFLLTFPGQKSSGDRTLGINSREVHTPP